MKRWIIGLLLVLCLGAVSPAKDLAGVTFPETCVVKGQTLALNGMALRKKFIFKVYVAALYVSVASQDATKILQSDAPRRGVMHFLRSVDAAKINEAWKDGLKSNTLDASAEVKQQFDSLCSYMEDVKNSETIEFAYLPGEGTEISVKGKSKGVIPGKAFIDALLSCWIGPKPGPGESFKKGLLGLK